MSARSAYEAVTKIRNEYHQVHNYRNYKITYAQFMEKIFLPHYKSDVEISTWESRKSAFKIMSDRFESKKVREISVADCELFRTYLLNETQYSKGYASLIYSAFRKSLDYCVNLNYIEKNVSRQTKAIPKSKGVVPYWTKSEFEKVLSVMCLDEFYEHMCFVIIWVYFMTGIRVSEGLALKWSDIDFDNKKLRVHGTLEWTKGKSKKYIVKPYTKTVNSLRTISIDDDTIFILKKWKERQFKHGVTEFIFSYTQRPLVRSTINRIVKRFAEKAHISIIQPKGLRHSHVSYLINEHNIDILVISKRLGHSSPEITLKHYSHLWNRNDSLVANVIKGNIQIQTAKHSQINFYGNQSVN